MKTKTIFVVLLLISTGLYPQIANYRISTQNANSPNETSITINPVDPNYIAAGANLSYFYISSDRGKTWVQKTMNSTLGVWGDPCLLYDHRGYLYYGHLSNPTVGYWIDRVVVQRSTDNGANWSDGAGVGLTPPKEQDKEWLAADMHSPLFKGNLYMAWTEFDNYGSGAPSDSTRILFSRSTDAGLTWMAPVKISDRSGDCVDEDNTVEGAVPAVGPNGEVYVAWVGPDGISFDRSFDGGLTFGTDVIVTAVPGGWDFNIPGIQRCNGLPITMCDTSNSPYRGNIYINWSDQRNGVNNTDVFVVRSTDGGDTWSQPIRVNNDNTTRHQFFTWMTIDQSTGFLYAIFYDRRNTTQNITDVYIAKSIDGGLTWENFKINETSFNPSASVFFGDYTGIAAHKGWVHPIWMRADNTTMSIWTAPFYDSTAVVPVELANFTGLVDNSTVLLEWQTATEVNNKGFEVEMAFSSDLSFRNIIWSSVGFVEGKGTSAQPVFYSFQDRRETPGYYKYRLKQIDYNGEVSYSHEVEVSVSNPVSFDLFQNYPNPFSGNKPTVISYQIPKGSWVSLKVFDVTGRKIITLVEGYKEAGVHEVNLDLSSVPVALPSGVYFYRLEAGEKTASKKLIYMR